MVLAAGLGTRLRPLTYELNKPMVPVLDRPVMAHIVDLLDKHGFEETIANLHYFPDSIREYFGERLSYRTEPQLLGTAGGVRGCAEFFGEQPFLVISGDALTDIDLGAFAVRHRETGGVATLAVKKVADTREYGVVLHDRAGRITGFQEKPAPEEALSDLGNCGIYIFEPRIFDYFPERPFVDWAQDVFPALLAGDVPFHIHEVHDYWNDVGSLAELRQGTFDALRGELRLEMDGEEVAPGVILASGAEGSGGAGGAEGSGGAGGAEGSGGAGGAEGSGGAGGADGAVRGEGADGAVGAERAGGAGGSPIPADAQIEGPIWVGRDVRVGAGVRLTGPLVLGDGARVGDGAQLRESILFPGTEVAAGAILIGAIAGHAGILQSMRPRR
jgi:mannose-1-phosphate guanylyltransferase